MAFFDLPLEQLRTYQPPREEPPDFDGFWGNSLDAARQYPLAASFEQVDYGLVTLETYDVTFHGYGGQPVKGWFLVPSGDAPSGRKLPLPLMVEYIGYGGGRGYPTDWLQWASAGFAHLVMDTRGQGSVWRHGDTPDPQPDGSGPHVPGFTTQGIQSPETYYYRRVFVDAVRAVEAALTNPFVDPERVAVTGGSQGGGISLAVAGLEPRVGAYLPDVPYLCHIRRAVEITDAQPYREISQYCQVHVDQVERVFHTLSYFDGLNFAARTKAAGFYSVGLMDETCPPSTVYAAYNHAGGEKDIRCYTYNHHEGGGSFHHLEKVKFLRNLWKM